MSISGISENISNTNIKENESFIDIAWSTSCDYFVPMEKVKDSQDLVSSANQLQSMILQSEDTSLLMLSMPADFNDALPGSENLLSPDAYAPLSCSPPPISVGGDDGCGGGVLTVMENGVLTCAAAGDRMLTTIDNSVLASVKLERVELSPSMIISSPHYIQDDSDSSQLMNAAAAAVTFSTPSPLLTNHGGGATCTTLPAYDDDDLMEADDNNFIDSRHRVITMEDCGGGGGGGGDLLTIDPSLIAQPDQYICTIDEGHSMLSDTDDAGISNCTIQQLQQQQLQQQLQQQQQQQQHSHIIYLPPPLDDSPANHDARNDVICDPNTVAIGDRQELSVDPTVAIQMNKYMLQQQISPCTNTVMLSGATGAATTTTTTLLLNTGESSVTHQDIGITNLHTSETLQLVQSPPPALPHPPPHHTTNGPTTKLITISMEHSYHEPTDLPSMLISDHDRCHLLDTSKQQDYSAEKYDFQNDSGETVLCTKCCKPCASKRALRDHIRIHTERVWKCNICNKSFKQKRNLHDHQSIHTGEKPYGCDKCARSFRLQRDLKDHLSIHSEERNFICIVCDKKFRQKRDLRDHSSVHSGEKNFACCVCSKMFRQKRDVRDHLKVHTNDRPYRCEICMKTFRNNRDLKDHHTVHTGEKPFNCSMCDKQFRQKRNLRDHERTHTAPMYVSSTSSSTSSSSSSTSKMFSCSMCQRVFRLKRELVIHVKRVHVSNDLDSTDLNTTDYASLYKSIIKPAETGPCDLLATVVSEANCSQEATSCLDY